MLRGPPQSAFTSGNQLDESGNVAATMLFIEDVGVQHENGDSLPFRAAAFMAAVSVKRLSKNSCKLATGSLRPATAIPAQLRICQWMQSRP